MKNIIYKYKDKIYNYSVTFQETTDESSRDGDFSDHGFEYEPKDGTLFDIIYDTRDECFNEVNNFVGSDFSISTTSPVNDRRYIEQGVEKYYTLHINSEISQEEVEMFKFIYSECRQSNFQEDDYNDEETYNMYIKESRQLIESVTKKHLYEMNISQEVHTTLNWASRELKQEFLEELGFAVYENEKESELDHAIIGLIEDGDITGDDVISFFS